MIVIQYLSISILLKTLDMSDISKVFEMDDNISETGDILSMITNQ